MPPALLTAATTSRQWLNAKMGNSMPSMSQTRVRMGLGLRGGAACDGFRPPVVGFSARAADDLVHDVQRAWDLVSGDGRAAVHVDVRQGRLPSLPRLNDGDDA